MGYKAKESVGFVVQETTEGDGSYPSSASDAVALQEAPQIDPQVSVLKNEEFVGGIDKNADIAGPETPSFSFAHYCRHSGQEGQAPNYVEFLTAAFGSKDEPAELTLTTGSTAGDASNRATLHFTTNVGLYQLRPFLIKDGVNGYSVRFAYDDPTGNNIPLNFNLTGAPASGVKTGDVIALLPTGNHPTLAFHSHNANEACYQLIRGMRVTEYGLEGTAEELIKQTFSLEGLEVYFDPIKFTSTSKYIDFVDDGGTKQAVLDVKTYGTPMLLAEAIASKMSAVSVNVISCSWSNSTGKFTISSNGTTLSLLWLTGAQTANSAKTKLGFNNLDKTGATTYTSDNEQDWSAQGVHGFSPTVDNEDPLVAIDNEVLLAPTADFNDFLKVSTRSVSFKMANTKVITQDMCQPTGKIGSSIVKREPTAVLTVNIKKHEVRFIDAMKRAKDCSMQWTFGRKDGASNWMAGHTGAIYMRQAKVTGHVVGTTDEEVTVEITISGFGKGSTKKSCAMGWF